METVKLRSGWVVLAGVFAVATVGTLTLVVAEMRYVSEQLVAVQERQDAFDRQLSAERARASNAGDEARAIAAEARERAAAERLARLEAVVRSLEERAGKAAASSKPEVQRPEVQRPEPVPARDVPPTPRARPQLKEPKLAAASAATPRVQALAPSVPSPVAASDELAPKPVALGKPALARKPAPTPAAEPQPKLFAEPTQAAQPLADRRLGL